MADGLKKFLKYVLERSKEINGSIHHESGGDDRESLLNELLLHVDLLGRTEIGNISSLDYQDKTKWKDLKNFYSEVCLYNELLL